LQRASELLASDWSACKEESRGSREQIPLAFGMGPTPSRENDLVLSAVRDLLMSKAPDEVTPKEALEILYKVQEIFHDQNGSGV
jgi:hypothetical protein